MGEFLPLCRSFFAPLEYRKKKLILEENARHPWSYNDPCLRYLWEAREHWAALVIVFLTKNLSMKVRTVFWGSVDPRFEAKAGLLFQSPEILWFMAFHHSARIYRTVPWESVSKTQGVSKWMGFRMVSSSNFLKLGILVPVCFGTRLVVSCTALKVQSNGWVSKSQVFLNF